MLCLIKIYNYLYLYFQVEFLVYFVCSSSQPTDLKLLVHKVAFQYLLEMNNKLIKNYFNVNYNSFLLLPNFTAISPIAHVALLQTDIWSGFKFCASIGIKSAKNKQNVNLKIL